MICNIARAAAGGAEFVSFQKTITTTKNPIIPELIGKQNFVAFIVKYSDIPSYLVYSAGYFADNGSFSSANNRAGKDGVATLDSSTGSIIASYGSPDVDSYRNRWSGTYQFIAW